jgi:hypothetical protein
LIQRHNGLADSFGLLWFLNRCLISGLGSYRRPHDLKQELLLPVKPLDNQVTLPAACLWDLFKDKLLFISLAERIAGVKLAVLTKLSPITLQIIVLLILMNCSLAYKPDHNLVSILVFFDFRSSSTSTAVSLTVFLGDFLLLLPLFFNLCSLNLAFPMSWGQP